MCPVLEFIETLRPVSYTVDKVGLNKFLNVNDSSADLSKAKSIPMRQTGFIAQEIEALVKKTGYVFDGIEYLKMEMILMVFGMLICCSVGESPFRSCPEDGRTAETKQGTEESNPIAAGTAGFQKRNWKYWSQWN